MNNKNAAISAALFFGALGVGGLLGHYLGPTKTIEVTKTVEVEKKSETKETEKRKETKTVKVTRPDGSTEERTETVEESSTTANRKSQKATEAETSKTVERKSAGLSLHFLAGADALSHGIPLTYGLHGSKTILAPVSVGAFGMTNGTFGLSLGLQF